MKIKMRALQLESLTKYAFRAPSWWVSLILIAIAGALIELLAYLSANVPSGLGIAVAVPQIAVILLTIPLTKRCYQKFTWNRAGLLALANTVFCLLFLFFAFLPVFNIIFSYILASGFTLALTIAILTAVVDYRTGKILPAALLPAVLQLAAVFFIAGPQYLLPALIADAAFAFAAVLFLRVFDKPLKRGSGLIAMQFVNIYISHITGTGSGGADQMEQYLANISEPAVVPETTFFFRREGKQDVWFVVPNLHPGPLSDIGGSNFPNILFEEFKDDALLFVSHGCASHDLNLISNNETEKIADAIRRSKAAAEKNPEFYQASASAPVRSSCGSVSILSQRLGNSLLMVATRSPEMTEDMDYSIGRIIIGEAKRWYEQVGFADGHNCMVKEDKITYPSTRIGNEYIKGATDAIESMRSSEMYPLSAGAAHTKLPFGRKDGFGDTGLVSLVTEAGGKKTAYVLFDGNNVKGGVRDILRDAVLKEGFDECEIMTTDSHIVNTISGRNPVGMAVPAEEILPYVLQSVRDAAADLSPAKVGAASEDCENVQVFGPGKIIQLTSEVSGIVSHLLPLFGLFLLAAALITVVTWLLL